MLNVPAVQRSVSKSYLKAVAEFLGKKNPKNKNKWDMYYDEPFGLFDGATSMCDLSYTCSAYELTSPLSDAALAQAIAEALREQRKYLQCSVTSKNLCKRLEKFGFSKVTDYMGKHGNQVYIYHINLEGFVF